MLKLQHNRILLFLKCIWIKKGQYCFLILPFFISFSFHIFLSVDRFSYTGWFHFNPRTHLFIKSFYPAFLIIIFSWEMRVTPLASIGIKASKLEIISYSAIFLFEQGMHTSWPFSNLTNFVDMVSSPQILQGSDLSIGAYDGMKRFTSFVEKTSLKDFKRRSNDFKIL